MKDFATSILSNKDRDMSIIDKAKEKISGVRGSIGEETVRIIDYDDPEEEVVEPVEPKIEKREKAPKPSFSMPKISVPSFPKSEPKPKPEPRLKPEPKPEPEVKVKPEVKKKVTPQKVSEPKPKQSSSEKSHLFSRKKKLQDLEKATEKLTGADQNTIKDVLDILDIPATFEIGRDIFLPEDIEKVDFDYQTPHGYDMGQVGAFVDQSRGSIKYFVSLLRQRNEDVAKLATVVDRLQVDLNNQRFDNEIANGINIMPTQDDDDIHNQNMELRLLNVRLVEENDRLKKGDDLSSQERAMFESLQDQLSLVTREKNALEDELRDIRTRAAAEEEDLDDDPVSRDKMSNYSDQDPYYEETYLTPSVEMPLDELPSIDDAFSAFGDGGYDYGEHTDNTNSPFFDGEDTTLTEFIEANQESYEESEDDDGAFSIIEVEDDTQQRSIETPIDTPKTQYFEEDDDELDAIMKQEFGENEDAAR